MQKPILKKKKDKLKTNSQFQNIQIKSKILGFETFKTNNKKMKGQIF